MGKGVQPCKTIGHGKLSHDNPAIEAGQTVDPAGKQGKGAKADEKQRAKKAVSKRGKVAEGEATLRRSVKRSAKRQVIGKNQSR